MCFIRKSLDWVFTRHELTWLDDIMPESHKREKADKKKKHIDEDPHVDKVDLYRRISSKVTISWKICLDCFKGLFGIWITSKYKSITKLMRV